MSSKTTKAENTATATENKQAAADTGADERVYPYNVLKANCRKLFGVSTSTFEGVTAGMENEKYTITKMKAILDEWLKKEVK